MSTRERHKVTEVEDALQYAEAAGWRVDVRHNGHVWGRIFCPLATRQGCQLSVGSTPKNNGNEAKRIRRYVDSCRCT